MRKYYVTMTDKFMSGWGRAEGKTSKLVFLCETYDDAETVAANAKARSEMNYVNISSSKPYYSPSKYHVAHHTKESSPNWYVPGYFK